eukprot:TRINITY_DN28066_c0_g1_i2.p3 TRINITY_DN28066_c0_g1~~TRINITY_DN28066_c0_g1_i2.p3  ORF type:complete len:106 (-),score=11.41 TRINITY_DN28066_c0_g1_i2:36-353(-)
MLAKTAKFIPQVSVCASCLLPGVFKPAKAGPSTLASSKGQHQEPISAGMERNIMQPPTKTDLILLLYGALFTCGAGARRGGPQLPLPGECGEWSSTRRYSMAKRI